MKKEKKISSQQGFTLIEVIAVLVILGILAAFAVPKYYDLQTKAKEKAIEGALAEAKSRVNAFYASKLLDGTPFASMDFVNDLGTNLGKDFTWYKLTRSPAGGHTLVAGFKYMAVTKDFTISLPFE